MPKIAPWGNLPLNVRQHLVGYPACPTGPTQPPARIEPSSTRRWSSPLKG